MIQLLQICTYSTIHHTEKIYDKANFIDQKILIQIKSIDHLPGQTFMTSLQESDRFNGFEIYQIDQDSSSLNEKIQIPDQVLVDAVKHCEAIKVTEKMYLINPEIYQSFRNEQLFNQIQHEGCLIRLFNKGRKEMHFLDTIEIFCADVSVVHWRNGDYKLISSQMVYYWHEQSKDLDKYCISF